MRYLRGLALWFKRRVIYWMARALGVANLLFPRGTVNIDHYRNGEKIGTYAFPNGIVDVGMNHLLGVVFHGDTPVTTWYIGIINNAGFSALANADTMGSHAGWAEFTGYDEADRVTWVEEAPGSRAIVNSVTSADFTINATATLKGIFVTSDNTKSGTTGTLWATAAFSSNINVQDDDVLKITYTVSG